MKEIFDAEDNNDEDIIVKLFLIYLPLIFHDY